MRAALIVVSALMASCASPPPKQDDSHALASASPSRDTLILRMADSAEIWFTEGMLDTAAGGETCEERTVEIRRAGTSTPVPLLYTLGPIEVVDDSSVRADLMRDCASVDRYLVNTRTGQPRRIP